MGWGNGFSHHDDDKTEYDGITMLVLICVLLVLLLLPLRAYVRWIWVQSRFNRGRRWRSPSGRSRFSFTVEEPEKLPNVGLDPAVLETLPMFVYRSHNLTDRVECAVCLSEFEENEKGRLLPNCKHRFHVECIDMWFFSHSTCPLCRSSVQPEEAVLESARLGHFPGTTTGEFGVHSEQPVLEYARLEHFAATIPGPIASGSHNNLNSVQGLTAGSEEEYNVQNGINILG